MANEASIVTGTPQANALRDRLAAAVGGTQSPSFLSFLGDPNLNRAPDYYLWVHNISRRKFVIRRPPQFPVVTIPACPPGQPYVTGARIPNIVNFRWVDAVNDEARSVAIAGERFAMDLINPANLGVDCWASVPPEVSWVDSGGDDLTIRGVFWTRNEVPAAEELRMAKLRMEEHYKRCIAQADELVQNGHRSQLNDEHHAAAEHFRLKATWHSVAELREQCPNCGEDVAAGLAFHRNGFGLMCILDWKRAVAAGVKTRADVPEGLRWWDDAEREAS